MSNDPRRTRLPHRSAVGLGLLLLLLIPARVFAAGADPWAKISPKALGEMAQKGTTVVVVRLAEDPAGPSLQAVANGEQKALAKLAAEPGWHLRLKLNSIPYLVGDVDYSALGALAGMPEVLSIEADARVAPDDIESNQQIGATRVQQAYGLTGAGVNVGIIDTGIDLNHPDFAAATTLAAGRRIMNQGATQDGNVQDDQGHGSHVAGIITSDGIVAPKGIAPAAKLVVVKAIGPAGGFVSDIAAGLDWITTNNAAHPVRYVNMSLEVLDFIPAQCPCNNLPSSAGVQVLTDAIARATAAGITVVASSGNDGDTVLRYPACLSTTISVGATFDKGYPYAPTVAGSFPTTGTFHQAGGSSFADCNHTTPVVADQLVCFSNRSTCMDFAAPGYNITSVQLGNNTTNLNSYGTSQAAAHVTAALALLQQAAPQLTNAQMLQLLHATAVKVPLNQSVPTGSQVDRIDILHAINKATLADVKDWMIFN